MSAKHAETIVESGTEIFIPLNKLKKSPKNARKTPHSEAAIEAYAASIAAKGILQNLVVEPELDGDGAATGFYFVTIGEGRRLAQLLRVKRKEIKKAEPIRCVIDTANDPHEISLDENVTREACILPISSKRSRSWRRNAVLARKKSPLGSASRRMLCGSACGWARSRPS
jgi:ParB family chromosome partitioning protein